MGGRFSRCVAYCNCFSNPDNRVTLKDGSTIKLKSPTPINLGNFGDLLKGVHSANRAVVALKRCRITEKGQTADQTETMENEATMWMKLRHPYVLPFLGIGRDSGNIMYLVSPWIENGSLWECMLDEKRSPGNHPRYLREVAEAVEYLHSQHMIHGDIKAQNVLISDEDHILLCDFGLAKLATSNTILAVKGQGTFNPPEVWKGGPRSYASDVYSFGITISQVLSCRDPSEHLGTTLPAIMTAVVNGSRPQKEPQESPEGMSYDHLWGVAEECWQDSPGERPAMSTIREWLKSPVGEPSHRDELRRRRGARVRAATSPNAAVDPEASTPGPATPPILLGIQREGHGILRHEPATQAQQDAGRGAGGDIPRAGPGVAEPEVKKHGDGADAIIAGRLQTTSTDGSGQPSHPRKTLVANGSASPAHSLPVTLQRKEPNGDATGSDSTRKRSRQGPSARTPRGEALQSQDEVRPKPHSSRTHHRQPAGQAEEGHMDEYKAHAARKSGTENRSLETSLPPDAVPKGESPSQKTSLVDGGNDPAKPSTRTNISKTGVGSSNLEVASAARRQHTATPPKRQLGKASSNDPQDEAKQVHGLSAQRSGDDVPSIPNGGSKEPVAGTGTEGLGESNHYYPETDVPRRASCKNANRSTIDHLSRTGGGMKVTKATQWTSAPDERASKERLAAQKKMDFVVDN
ncbi:hypothetical protein FRB99_000190 [Tulasnella sp. 403]|nr:hypothetical protein FRB99_000190 [Tulasnella sp. 403]